MRMPSPTLLVAVAILASSGLANAAFLIQIDLDGSVSGTAVTQNPRFSFGAGTTSASVSTAASTAVGLAPGHSYFSGDAVLPDLDTYVFTYTPSTTVGDLDNLSLSAGTALNTVGSTASGLSAGATGLYAAYAAWPSTTNVSGGPTSFVLPHDAGTLNVQINQNALSNQWIFLGNVQLTEGNSYRLSQIAGSNTFVSMRSSGVMFDRIPEPSATLLLATALAATARFRRRR